VPGVRGCVQAIGASRKLACSWQLDMSFGEGPPSRCGRTTPTPTWRHCGGWRWAVERRVEKKVGIKNKRFWSPHGHRLSAASAIRARLRSKSPCHRDRSSNPPPSAQGSERIGPPRIVAVAPALFMAVVPMSLSLCAAKSACSRARIASAAACSPRA